MPETISGNMLEEITALTMELIRFPSVHANSQAIARCADFIENYLHDNHLSWRRFEHSGIPSFLVTPDTDRFPVLLMSHFDVVDAPPELFLPFVSDGKLYGRGSIDDKYAVALSLVLLKTRLEELRFAGLSQKNLPFGILLTGDEEIGGAHGARKVLPEIRPEFCIALDGGDPDTVVIHEKGIYRLKLIARGKAAHGARPWLGENAIEKLMDDYARIRPFFEVTAPEHWHRTMTLSILRAGESPNQVPDTAEAVLDIRYTESDPMTEILEEIRKAIRGEIEILSMAPVFHGGTSPHLDRLLGIRPEIRLGREHGASDARHLMEHGIPGIVWGADGDKSAHSLDEHIHLDSLESLAGILRRFLWDFPETP